MKKSDAKKLWAAYQKGLACEKAGDADGAAKHYALALRLDPADHGGVSVRLAALGRAAAPDRAPTAYVETLFDQHAADFDDILVAQLGYRTPQDIAAALPGRFGRMLDLGCGTGLVGAALRAVTDHRTGVDIAENMVALAHAKGDYDDLYVGEIEACLGGAAEDGETWDLSVAADVLPYLGDMGTILRLAAGRLVPGGLLVFSTETAPEAAFGDAGWIVGPAHRFAHAQAYLRRTLDAAGLAAEAFDPIVVRHDDGAPVRGHLVRARKAALGDAAAPVLA